MTAHTLKAGDLAQFTGTEQWFRHGLMRHVTYTEGARHVAEAPAAPTGCSTRSRRASSTRA